MLKLVQKASLVMALTALTFGAAQVDPAGESPEAVPLIPREVLFGDPDRSTVRLSHDGAQLAYLAPLDGVRNVWIAPADDPEAAEPLTSDSGRGIQDYTWAYTGEHILYIQDEAGDENWRIYSVDTSSQGVQDLTPLEGVQAQFQHLSPDFPEEVLVRLNDRVPQLHDVYRLNIISGERELVYENEGFVGFISDDAYNLRYGMMVTPDGGAQVFERVEDDWQLAEDIPMEDILTTSPVGLNRAGTTLYMIDSRGRDTAALTATDLSTGETTVLYEDSRADVDNAIVHPVTGEVQAAASTYERRSWEVLDPGIQADLDYLDTVADGDFYLTSRTVDDGRWIVAYIMDNDPVRYYLYEREAGEASFLFTNRQDLEGQPLTQMHPVVITARDGLELVSYLSLPLWADEGEPLPMVLNVHGGPWARDEWGYHPEHQWLANRGYAVLSVNFRGSTGFGKDFINAGNLEWGAAMHDDLIDAVNWAVQAGIADPEQVAIYGGSYGGYATLVGLTFTPEVFAAGVNLVGPSNLVTLLESIPPYWEPQVELFTTRVGDHRTEEGREFLLERSPISHVDNIVRPLLIGHGANDPRVRQAESDQIVTAMQERDIPVTYVVYPDEGHGFARPANRLSFYAIAEAFLAEHLGGRFEEVGDDFLGSSLTVPVGAEEVPGLKEALPQP
jgi:dipeptidyl aminopeptidase/acylaminoacyl peptidase